MDNKGQNLQFRYFLTFEIWKEALRLLNHQISEKKPPRPNRHYNTINYFYFEKISSEAHKLENQDYFNDKIANNFFYGLEKEFFYYHYTVPKSGVGLRKYVFLGYPMTILYYSIGLYLLKVTEQFIEDCKKENNINNSYYGGNLSFDELGKINATHSSTYYKYQYDKFKKQVKQQANEAPSNNVTDKVVVKLDIQNYFETIVIDKMLDLISHYVKPSDLKKYNFDASTKEMLIFYFSFLNNGNIGIPQGYTNTISSFIGYFYLIFGDLFISDLVEKFNDIHQIIEKHKIIRYVDDTYISITFSENIPKNEKESLVYELLKSISDCFYSKLNLRFNSKLELFFLDNPKDREALIKSVKGTSPYLTTNDDENKDNPQFKFTEIIKVIGEIKERELVFVFKEKDHERFIEVLNETYDKSVEEIVNIPSNLTKLEEIFTNFNFDLFRIHPRVLTILISKTEKAKEAFINYLIEKKPLTTFDADLIINFLGQNDFNEAKLFEKLKQNPSIEPIINQFINPQLVCDLDFYNFEFANVIELSKDIHISEQTRLRVYHEKLGEYSIALNHLLNEIHAICRLKDKKTTNPKKYDANKVIEFLISLKINSEVKAKIRNLFDRRNKNPISHPGSDEAIAWAVSKIEYEEYKGFVRQCLAHILKKKVIGKIKKQQISNLIAILLNK